MSGSEPKKIHFPRIDRIELRNFDLFSREKSPNVSVERNVFCLIGANGLGKSTFLNTVAFAITGAIPEPYRKFHSADDYYKHAARHERTEEYFGGRISESARRVASVKLELSWPTKTVAVTRELFGERGVSRLEIRDASISDVKSFEIGNPELDSNLDLNVEYENEIRKLCGLEEFSQFVFLIHFVSMFDEGRHLLMWDDAALTNALYLAFGTDAAAARNVDKLQHDMDRESSRGRNVRFSARHVADRIGILEEVLKGNNEVEHVSAAQLESSHEALIEQRTEAEDRLRRKQSELRDADLKWTDLSANLTELQLEYRRVFSNRLHRSSSVEHHPIIRASLSEDRCAICGTDHIASAIKFKLESSHCPLCESTVAASSGDSDALSKLQQLDRSIAVLRDNLVNILATRERVSAEVDAAQASEEAAVFALREFEEKESGNLSRSRTSTDFSAIKTEIAKLEGEKAEFILQSEEHYKKRDAIREKLRIYEKEFKSQYELGAQQFVPRFRELAESFIGLPIDVELEHRQGANDAGFGLRLRMNDQLRTLPQKVSESQRFFIDIALRMALAEFMAVGPATLFIDTPEGSLDIAYEARAGVMFSKFVKTGNAIFMTANLRSSELVIRLAELEKKAGMQVVRMTDWTDLSEVQQSEERLFTEAYASIDSALN
jgi:energy-coupling factor transporter ATP-binding protein EcfA2